MGLESNVFRFINDFWLYESSNNFSELTEKIWEKGWGEGILA